jgi:hypothetical protein
VRGWFPPILALMLAACTQPPELNQPDTRNLFAPGTSAVVEPSVLTNATCGRLGIPDRGVWTSTSAQVIELEEVLLERLKAELVRDAEEFGVNNIAPSDYLRR